jgi:hypothetical protein
MTISIRKTWFAAVLVAALAAPAAQAHPLTESGALNTGAVETTVAAGNDGLAQSQIAANALVRGARERLLEQSAADAVSMASPSVASVSSEGFHLRDAGIGAAVTGGVLVLGGALALGFHARTRRRAVHA